MCNGILGTYGIILLFCIIYLSLRFGYSPLLKNVKSEFITKAFSKTRLLHRSRCYLADFGPGKWHHTRFTFVIVKQTLYMYLCLSFLLNLYAVF